jgi:hypothetical protein
MTQLRRRRDSIGTPLRQKLATNQSNKVTCVLKAYEKRIISY